VRKYYKIGVFNSNVHDIDLKTITFDKVCNKLEVALSGIGGIK